MTKEYKNIKYVSCNQKSKDAYYKCRLQTRIKTEDVKLDNIDEFFVDAIDGRIPISVRNRSGLGIVVEFGGNITEGGICVYNETDKRLTCY